MHPSLALAPGLRASLDARCPDTRPTVAARASAGAVALAPAFPLALSGLSLAYRMNNSVSAPPRRMVPASDRPGLWLRNAAAGLCVLAAAAAAVSFTAQFRMVDATRHLPAIAAVPGWRNLAIWAMPPIAYALASDTLIGVVRAWTLARHQHTNTTFAADQAGPLAILGGLILWLLRLALAPASTLAGFRAWVLAECPVAPAPRTLAAPSPHVAKVRGETKTSRFLSLVTERHGPLASIPLNRVAQISARLAPQVGLNSGAARTALRKAVLAARNGDPR